MEKQFEKIEDKFEFLKQSQIVQEEQINLIENDHDSQNVPIEEELKMEPPYL